MQMLAKINYRVKIEHDLSFQLVRGDKKQMIDSLDVQKTCDYIQHLI